MIIRYTLEPMGSLWTQKSKYESWLAVELAALQARVALGEVEQGIYEYINASAVINEKRIAEIEEEVDHDLLAFVNQIQEEITARHDAQCAVEFHKRLTSYDTEDPALVLQLRKAIQLILDEARKLEAMLLNKALEHKWTIMIHRTHGQDAEPGTFGQLLMVFKECAARSVRRLEYVLAHELAEAKMSGAVGTYGGNNPKFEELALGYLRLAPAKAETQILQRDRHAAVINTLAEFAGSIEQIARTFWEMMRSSERELEEPQKKKQKGSSAMSHKKNPILTERLMGMSRLMRGYAVAMNESIATPESRDVSQSSVERVVLPDATTLIHYMVAKLTGLVERLVVFPEHMRKNLDVRTRGIWASQPVRTALMDAGVDSETAYRYTQHLAFQAVEKQVHFSELLASNALSNGDNRTAAGLLGSHQLTDCFNAEAYLRDGINYIFEQYTPERS